MPRPPGEQPPPVRRLARGGAALLAAVLVACTPGEGDPSVSPPVEGPPSIRTLSPLPAPSGESPTGRLHAELRQSSRDVALGRMQVWLTNGTRRRVRPRALVYRDGRFPRPLPGRRLRPVPAGGERGYPLALPAAPRCAASPGRVTLDVVLGARRQTIQVEDPTDVAGRYWSSRCLERGVDEVARLRWLDDVVSAGHDGAVGVLVLEVRPTGRRARAMILEEVGGTPLLGPVGASGWTLGERVTGTGEPRRIRLPVRPVRCDGHAFAEAAGATAFRVHVVLDGRRGSFLLRMSPQGTSRALAYAREVCGLDGR